MDPSRLVYRGDFRSLRGFHANVRDYSHWSGFHANIDGHLAINDNSLGHWNFNIRAPLNYTTSYPPSMIPYIDNIDGHLAINDNSMVNRNFIIRAPINYTTSYPPSVIPSTDNIDGHLVMNDNSLDNRNFDMRPPSTYTRSYPPSTISFNENIDGHLVINDNSLDNRNFDMRPASTYTRSYLLPTFSFIENIYVHLVNDPGSLVNWNLDTSTNTRGMSEEDHRDEYWGMRLNDIMSNENLLPLRNGGAVNDGLSEEIILKHLKIRILLSNEDNKLCSICQDHFAKHDKIGTLDCGNEYHMDCVKNWLKIKNTCPNCRATGLTLSRRHH